MIEERGCACGQRIRIESTPEEQAEAQEKILAWQQRHARCRPDPIDRIMTRFNRLLGEVPQDHPSYVAEVFRRLADETRRESEGGRA